LLFIPFNNEKNINAPKADAILLCGVIDKPSAGGASIFLGQMKTISLTQDKFALVDDEDYEWLSKFNWCVHKVNGNNYVAMRGYFPEPNGKEKTLLMHRSIMNPPKNMQVDHIDHNSLNNQKANLRICTHRDNQRNRRPRGGTSKYMGVCYYKQTGKFCASIRPNNKTIHLGYFTNEEDAAIVYDEAAKKYYGEFANLNFPIIKL
jgi:hypothetical protein